MPSSKLYEIDIPNDQEIFGSKIEKQKSYLPIFYIITYKYDYFDYQSESPVCDVLFTHASDRIRWTPRGRFSSRSAVSQVTRNIHRLPLAPGILDKRSFYCFLRNIQPVYIRLVSLELTSLSAFDPADITIYVYKNFEEKILPNTSIIHIIMEPVATLPLF